MYTPKPNYEKAISKLLDENISVPARISCLSGHYLLTDQYPDNKQHTLWVGDKYKRTGESINFLFFALHKSLKITPFNIPNVYLRQWVITYFWLKAVLMGLPASYSSYKKDYSHIFVEVTAADFYYFEEIHNKLLEMSKAIGNSTLLLRYLWYNKTVPTYLTTLTSYDSREFNDFIKNFRKFIFDSQNTKHYFHLF